MKDIIIKFDLSGNTAFFKKPDVNSSTKLTYPQIHKVALLGILGAICGYNGYIQQKENNNDKKNEKQEYPEFYEKLNDIKIGISPKKTYFNTTNIVKTNTTGFTNKEGTEIIKEQWLENPEWTIYLLIKDKTHIDLIESLKNGKFVYNPYLGGNSHFADIKNFEVIEGFEEINNFEDLKIQSILYEKRIEFETDYDEDENNFEVFYLPIALDYNNFYIKEKAYLTNNFIKSKINNLYKIQNKIIQFI